MAVILVITVLGTALVARAVQNLTFVRHGQDFAAALANADGGLSDALFRIDQGATTAFCVGTSTSSHPCVASSVPGAPGVQYQATPVDPSTGDPLTACAAGQTPSPDTCPGDAWRVQVLGTSGNPPVLHGIQALVTRSAAYPFALFGNGGLIFNGESSCGFATYDSTPPGSAIDCSGAVSIGSNGTIACNGGLGSNVTAVYYTGGGGISGSCGNTNGDPSPYSVPTKSPPGDASPGSCPATNGIIGSANTTTTLQPGVYVCSAPVTLEGNIVIASSSTNGGVVDLYVDLPSSQNTSTTQALSILGGSTVNYDASSNPYPVAADLRIFSNSIGTVADYNGSGTYTFAGVIYAPQANLTGDGCKSTYYGALVINTLTCNGGPHLTINYDLGLQDVKTPWTMSDYSEIPSTSVTIGS